MMIVDSQVHLWVAGWAPGPPYHRHRQQPVFSIKDILPEMNEAGVDRVVIVPPNWDSDAQAIETARLQPKRFAVMGRVELDDPRSRSLVENWGPQTGLLGLRLVFSSSEKRAWLSDGTADWIWPAAERAGIPLMILVPGSLSVVPAIAQRHPNLRLIIDHLGVPRATHDDAAFSDLPQLLALARYPNISVKASGVPALSTQPYPYRNVHDPLRRVFDAFGPKRMFWGTDLTRMPCSYKECVTLFTEELPWLKGNDLSQVMGSALCDLIGWK